MNRKVNGVLVSCSRYWEQLVWLDPTNYAGVKGKSEEIQSQNEEEDREDEEPDDTVSIRYNYAIKSI